MPHPKKRDSPSIVHSCTSVLVAAAARFLTSIMDPNAADRSNSQRPGVGALSSAFIRRDEDGYHKPDATRFGCSVAESSTSQQFCKQSCWLFSRFRQQSLYLGWDSRDTEQKSASLHVSVTDSPPEGAWPAVCPACHTTPAFVGIEFHTGPRGSGDPTTPNQSLMGCCDAPRTCANVNAATCTSLLSKASL
jgi:hypothetical protein